MNALTTISTAQTMSSREIADLVEVRHDSVRRTIERLAERGAIQLPPLVEVRNHLGQAVAEYRVGKRDSYVIVAQLSPEFTARLVDRWQELEARASERVDPMAMLNDPSAMRGLLLSYSEKVIELEEVNAVLAPKAVALERLAESDGTFTPTDAAKTLGVRPTTLISWLRGPGHWMYRRPGGSHDIAYQDKLQKGWMVHRTFTFERADGTDKTVTQARITAKGMAALAEIFNGVDQPRVYAENRVRELREQRGLSMQKLAESMDIVTTRATIFKLETGQMALSLDYIRSIAKALDVSPAEIVKEGSA